MSQYKKSGKDVKVEVITVIDLHIKGFKDVEPDSPYFNGYRAALKAIKESMERIEVQDDDNPKESKVTIL